MQKERKKEYYQVYDKIYFNKYVTGSVTKLINVCTIALSP